ncbi:hypothetical protein JK635_02025 [Neobacillus sp. YIM B02564]|uniref:Uncharacterized protein n=1 Tax=Neobacillus paridis TaxID=2803862 RepID=A0ABS1TIC4_9BACI|nr:hypothetical protein [Neobacillus paridis]MBL4951017.1 hypothetical protein [Neobacillus paridis]
MKEQLFLLLKENGKKINYELVDVEFNNISIFITDGFGVDEENLLIGQEGKKFYNVYEAYDFLNNNNLLEVI